MIAKFAGSDLTYVINDIDQTFLKITRRLVIEEMTRFRAGTDSVLDLLWSPFQMDRLTLEPYNRFQRAKQVVDRHRSFVRTNIDDLRQTAITQTKRHQA